MSASLSTTNLCVASVTPDWLFLYIKLLALPHRKVGSTYNEYIVPGWNNFVAYKHGEAREAYLNWLAAGKPRNGPYFDNMKCYQARFKLAFRYCKQHQEMMQANALAQQLSGKNYNKFWNDIKKHNNGRSTKYVSYSRWEGLQYVVEFVVEFKYLGQIILHNMSDNADTDREIRNMFFRANILVRKFSKCSITVKIQLFKSLCINLYGSALWHQYSA